MTKEYLEALKTIKIKCHPNSNPNPLVDSALDTIKQALQRLEAIDNANPSEAMKCLERLQSNIRPLNDYYYSDEQRKCYETIKQALIKSQEQEKVLKIIFEKNVDIFRLKKLDFNTFNQLQKSCKLPELTQEEFDTLKKWSERKEVKEDE